MEFCATVIIGGRQCFIVKPGCNIHCCIDGIGTAHSRSFYIGIDETLKHILLSHIDKKYMCQAVFKLVTKLLDFRLNTEVLERADCQIVESLKVWIYTPRNLKTFGHVW
jgi:hypothetical protein